MAITLNAPSQVRPYATFSSFPATGSLKTIYIAEDTNKIYRWTGSAYVELSETDATTWGSITGTLSAQTDLQTALDAKFDEPTGNSTQYLDGTGAPTTFPTALPPSGTAGGDLTGTYPNPTVHRIHGIDLQNGTPSANDVWVYGGSPAKWQHQHLNASQVDNDSSVTGTTVELALEHLDSTKVPTTRTLTINGTTQDLSADRTFTISTGITIGTTAITSGTVGRVLFEGTGNVVQESANLFWDNTNARLGLGTATPSAPLGIVGSTATTGLISITNNFSGQYPNAMTILFPNQTSSSLQSAAFYVGKALTSKNGYGFNYIHSADTSNANRGSIAFYGVDNILNWFASGNVTINTTTDAGFKLDVNGTARVQGQITTTTANAQFGTVGASTGNFRIDGVNGAGYAFAVYSSSTLRFGVVGYGGIDMPSGFSVVSGSTDLTTTRLRIGTGNTTAAINIQAQTGNTDIVSFKASNGGDQFTIKNTSGNILVGTSTDVPSSKLTIQSTTQGFLPPRMDTTQKNAIATPATGLMVYDTTLNLISVYNGTTWITL